MLQPTPLKRSLIGGCVISTVYINLENGGGYPETRVFLNRPVEGLVDHEEMDLYPTWQENHTALYTKVGNILAFGPA